MDCIILLIRQIRESIVGTKFSKGTELTIAARTCVPAQQQFPQRPVDEVSKFSEPAMATRINISQKVPKYHIPGGFEEQKIITANQQSKQRKITKSHRRSLSDTFLVQHPTPKEVQQGLEGYKIPGEWED